MGSFQIISVLSAIAAVSSVSIALLSYCSARRIYVLAPKREVLRRLLGSLHTAALSKAAQEGGGDPFSAANEAAVVFGDHKDVVDKLKKAKRLAGNNVKELIPLIRAMAVAAKVNLDAFDDNYLLTAFSPPKPTPANTQNP